MGSPQNTEPKRWRWNEKQWLDPGQTAPSDLGFALFAYFYMSQNFYDTSELDFYDISELDFFYSHHKSPHVVKLVMQNKCWFLRNW